mmetsp:Transcript_181074/g.574454  ORF Transcript_181074/g.574454 Transcript_181074/m.574454 type:complete len:299 (+) Transcript_181074:2691-3587(+)
MCKPSSARSSASDSLATSSRCATIAPEPWSATDQIGPQPRIEGTPSPSNSEWLTMGSGQCSARPGTPAAASTWQVASTALRRRFCSGPAVAPVPKSSRSMTKCASSPDDLRRRHHRQKGASTLYQQDKSRVRSRICCQRLRICCQRLRICCQRPCLCVALRSAAAGHSSSAVFVTLPPKSRKRPRHRCRCFLGRASSSSAAAELPLSSWSSASRCQGRSAATLAPAERVRPGARKASSATSTPQQVSRRNRSGPAVALGRAPLCLANTRRVLASSMPAAVGRGATSANTDTSLPMPRS